LSKGTLIAVVDDDDSVREALAALLKSIGYDAVAFERAEDFLSSDHRRGADCLIADIQMPGMTGFDLYARIAASGQAIPTILITAYPDRGAQTRALRDGVKACLTKPFTEDELLRSIRLALESRSE
jgi:FixJ family two-component response regulator